MKCLFLVVLAVLISVSYQQPIFQRCYESPEAWSGFFFMRDFFESRSDFGYVYYNRTELKVLYDYDNIEGRSVDVRKVWVIYEERKIYTYHEATRTCTAKEIDNERFPTFGAPQGATFRHQDRLGSYLPSLGVNADYFRMDTDGGGVFHGFYSPLYDTIQSDRMCVPVIESYEKIDAAPTHQSETHFTFMNITTTPIDREVWIIPRECFEP